jgi:hypothetical protein
MSPVRGRPRDEVGDNDRRSFTVRLVFRFGFLFGDFGSMRRPPPPFSASFGGRSLGKLRNIQGLGLVMVPRVLDRQVSTRSTPVEDSLLSEVEVLRVTARNFPHGPERDEAPQIRGARQVGGVASPPVVILEVRACFGQRLALVCDPR